MSNEKKDGLEKKRAAKQGKDKKNNAFAASGKRLTRWFREMRSELKKVVWPTRKQLINNTIIVFVVMVVVGVVLWGFDQVALLVVNTLISIGK